MGLKVTPIYEIRSMPQELGSPALLLYAPWNFIAAGISLQRITSTTMRQSALWIYFRAARLRIKWNVLGKCEILLRADYFYIVNDTLSIRQIF